VTRLDGVPARQVQPTLAALYRQILAQQPDAIGGAMPADEYYGP
jgi:NitT/TauT family transport system substrate-binding protein